MSDRDISCAGNTLQELATRIGVDPIALADTVAE